MIFTASPEIVAINFARSHAGDDMAPLPNDADLNETLREEGFTTCEGKKYSWALTPLTPDDLNR
jgi:hypothetical protein